MSSAGVRLQVLIVCTGNICRSPMGEVVVRTRLAEAGLGARIAVASAGTWGENAGDPVDPRAVAIAARRGYDLQGMCAAAVEPVHFARCDLLLGMTAAHVQQLEMRRPRGARAEIRRYLDLTAHLELRDVPDPYLGTEADFEFTLDLIELGATGVVAHLQGRVAG